MATISIIVPAYNAAEWLSECLDSISVQDFDDWQTIIVDDGSTDNTHAIAAGYAQRDTRFRLLSRPNGGPSAARNTALDAVKTPFVTFVDADDTLHPHALRHLMSLFDSYPDESIAACQHTETPFEQGKELPAAMTQILGARQAIISTLRRCPRFEPMSCAKAFRTDLFNDIRYTDGRRYEDLDIFYRLYWRAGSIIYDNAPIYYYRQHSGSFVHRWDNHRTDVLDVTDDIVSWACNLGEKDIISAARDRRLSARFNTFVSAARIRRRSTDMPDNADIDATIARCRADIRADRIRALLAPRTRLRNRIALLIPTAILARL